MSERIKDNITLFHEHNIYLPTKTITMTDEVNEDLYENMIKNIHALDSTNGAITIKINSPGGDMLHARAIYDAIRSCKNVIRGVVYGEASSSASLILQACDERIMTENSELMIHVGTEGHVENHPKNIEAYHKQYRLYEKWMEDIYLARIKEKKKKFTRPKLKKILEYDTIFTPKVALEYGLIDKIGEIQ